MTRSKQQWSIVPPGPVAVRGWSFGRVGSIPDLYSPRIFGPSADMTCSCGKYSGKTAEDGIICDQCGVRVSRDSLQCRRTRFGHIELACPCGHPASRECLLFDFPIVPVAYRVHPTDGVTPLGRAYEKLVEANMALARELPEKNSEAYYMALRDCRRGPLVEAMRNVLGIATPRSTDSSTKVEAPPGSLLPLLMESLASGGEDAATFIRGCCYAIEVNVSL